MIEILLIYLAAVNAAAVCLYGLDKYFAVKHKWRISEHTLLLLGALGGAAGGLLGMFFFHHKTQKYKFTILMPLFLAVYVLLLTVLIVK